MRRWYLVVAAALAVGVVAMEVAGFGPALRDWDWLLVSGFAALLASAYASLLLPDRVTGTVTRLARRGVYVGRADPSDLLHRVHRRARLVGTATGVVFVGLVVLAFVLAFGDRIVTRALFLTVAAFAAVPVGLFVGRAVVYGRLGRRLTATGGRIVPEPRHLDGTAGLLPIGDLYFYQAKLIAVPATHLAAWWLLIPLLGDRYAYWRDIYVGLLAVVVGCGILVFVVPMLWFHRVMTAAKAELQREADALSQDAAGDLTDAGRQRYAAIEEMPTWPVDTRMRRRFGLGNIVLLIPVLAQALGASESTSSVLSDLGRIISGQ